MIKKVLIVFTSAFLLQLVLISCCPDPTYYYFRITDILSANCQFQTELSDSATVKQEEYRLKINIAEETYAQLFTPNLFINQAVALSCEEDFVGLDTKIVSFLITADQDIYDTRAGEPIDYNKFSVNTNGFDSGGGIPVEEWLYNINNSGYLYGLSWYFQLNETIVLDNFIKFKINIVQEDGTAFERQTAAVRLVP